jgi:peptide/nickel transport system permease protein
MTGDLSAAPDGGAVSGAIDPGLASAPVPPVAPPSQLRQRQWLATLAVALKLTRTRIGLGIVTVIVLIAILGPVLAPHSPTAFVGLPNSGPSSHALFGTDQLGRDVWSRFLHGGLSLLGLAIAATAIGIVLGLIIGLTAAYGGGALDEALMRTSDVFLAFPPIVLALLVVSALGPKLWLLVVTVGISHAPRVARVMRGAALQVVERDFVKAAEAVGESRRRILFGELLPNVTSPLLVEIGLRLTYSIGLVAGLSFLGFGLQPPRADWGLMIYENRLAISVQPWGVLLPVLAIALLTIGTNLITDGIARAAIGLDREDS